MIEFPLTDKLADKSVLVARLSKWLFAILLVVASALPTARLAHAQGQVHRVAYGETLANIAYAYGIDSSELARANDVVNTNMLYIGQELTSPVGVPSSAPVAAQPEVATETTAAIEEIVSVVSEESATATIAESASSDFSGYVTFADGDTLSQIATTYGMSVSEIMRMNSLNDVSDVWVGKQLYVTGSVAATATSSVTEPIAESAVESTVAEATAVESTAAESTVAESTVAESAVESADVVTVAESTTTVASTASAADAIYTVTYGDTLSKIAVRYGISSARLVEANGLPNANHVWIGQRLRIPDGANANVSQAASWPQVSQSPAAYGRKLIEVDLSKQTLTAWQGDQQMLHTYISSGTYKTPTVTGRFRVSWKLPSQHMYGDDFDLPGVPWVMYFYEGYAIHGAYWHANFGMPMSHGCVNMVPSQAQFLYNWAPVGTEIWVHY